MAAGHGKRLRDGHLTAVAFAVGRALLAKYFRTETKLDGTEYIIVREDEVLGIVTGT